MASASGAAAVASAPSSTAIAVALASGCVAAAVALGSATAGAVAIGAAVLGSAFRLGWGKGLLAFGAFGGVTGAVVPVVFGLGLAPHSAMSTSVVAHQVLQSV